MWKLLEIENPDDNVIGTGETRSVRESADIAFKYVGCNYENHVIQTPSFLRSSDLEVLISNSARARQKSAWELKGKFQGLVEMMVAADLKRMKETM
jgi:GDPmannose 4,6-dehydratase